MNNDKQGIDWYHYQVASMYGFISERSSFFQLEPEVSFQANHPFHHDRSVLEITEKNVEGLQKRKRRLRKKRRRFVKVESETEDEGNEDEDEDESDSAVEVKSGRHG